MEAEFARPGRVVLLRLPFYDSLVYLTAVPSIAAAVKISARTPPIASGSDVGAATMRGGASDASIPQSNQV